jgi:hypothetical protein
MIGSFESLKGSIEMRNQIILGIAFGVLASSLVASKSDAQYRYLGGSPYFGGINGSYNYPSAGIGTYGGGYNYGIGTYTGFLGNSPYFGGVGSNYGFSQNNSGLINSIYGYSAPNYYGAPSTALPNGYGVPGYYGFYGSPLAGVNGYGASPIDGVGVLDGSYVSTPQDPGIAAVNSGVEPVAGTGGRGVVVIHGPTGLKDSIDVSKPSATKIKVSWSGNPATIKQMTFSILDSSHQTIDSQIIAATPAQATFTMRKRSVYYRVFIQYLDGATRSITAPL